jgi:hypothetical protein
MPPRFFKPTTREGFNTCFVLFRWRAGEKYGEAIFNDGEVIPDPQFNNSYFEKRAVEEITEAEAALILSFLPPLFFTNCL